MKTQTDDAVLSDEDIDALHGAYRRARKDFEKANARLNILVEAIHELANECPWTRGPNPGEKIAKPLSAVALEKYRALPNADEIEALGDEWRRCEQARRQAYIALPRSEQGHVAKP